MVIDMIFADLLFIYLFLPLCLLAYFITKKQSVRNVVLIIFSLIFYAWGEPVWVILLIFSAFVDYFNGLFIEKHFGTKKAKIGVVVSLIINLGLLFVFKYSGFVLNNINELLDLGMKVPEFRLPVGISFYTFQTISYSIDCYRGVVKTQHNFFRFLMYVSLFPQLVAGPIVRYSVVDKEIDERHTSITDFAEGITRTIVGLAKKVIIANGCSVIVSDLLDGQLSNLSAAGAWLGIIAFTFQIYFDFSGYSDMAIGMGRIFGFHFDENFNYPYISKSITEFWRRWHISLGSFFRDYLYIPLGGNRKRAYLNLFIVWFMTGLWHGASWNFILWGLYFGVIIFIERLTVLKFIDKIPSVIMHIYSLFLIVFGWAIFYFTDLSRLGAFIVAMFGANGGGFDDAVIRNIFVNNLFLLIAAAILSTPISKFISGRIEKIKSPDAYMAVGTCKIILTALLLLISSVLLVSATSNPFLYYRF